jgi:aspartyl-tRNA(Asn)/glutamyl-tRNA(Gln) amidotransferase subunit A
MSEIWELGVRAIRDLVAERRASPVEIARSFLDRITALDPQLRAFAHVAPERVEADARVAEAAVMAGGPLGPLHGVPVALKDIVDLADAPTGNGSQLTHGQVAAADAVVAARLKAAGAIVIGKTETHEFAIGGPDDALPYGPARNPWNLAHYPGGSSSGSGAAVAAGLAPCAIGTDTGGSIRIPAAYCGLAGMKATYGRVSRRGVSPLAYSLDHIGPMTWTVADNALMLEAIAGHDPLDPASADRAQEPYTAAAASGPAGLRIGLVHGFHESGVEAEAVAAFDAAAESLASAGATLVEVRLPPIADYVACNRVILLSEAYAVHEADFLSRPELFGPYLRARLLPGALFTAADYVQALRRRRELVALTAAAMREVDVLLVAGAAGPAPRLDAVGPDTIFTGPPSVTSPFNVTGLPALSVPAGLSASGLPLSVQLVGHPFGEAAAYRAGQAVEEALGERARRPALAHLAEAA